MGEGGDMSETEVSEGALQQEERAPAVASA